MTGRFCGKIINREKYFHTIIRITTKHTQQMFEDSFMYPSSPMISTNNLILEVLPKTSNYFTTILVLHQPCSSSFTNIYLTDLGNMLLFINWHPKTISLLTHQALIPIEPRQQNRLQIRTEALIGQQFSWKKVSHGNIWQLITFMLSFKKPNIVHIFLPK